MSSNPTFVWIISGKLLTEQLSIITLTSILEKSNINCKLIYSKPIKQILKELTKINPVAVGYSIMYGSHRSYYEISRAIRTSFPHIYQIAGGPFTTFYNQCIEEFAVDAIAKGEADLTLPILLQKIVRGEDFSNSTGFIVKSNGKIHHNDLEYLPDDLDQFPFANREILYQHDRLLKNQEFKSFISGRGCPYPCTYCFNHSFNKMYHGKGNIIRKKSAAYFVEELCETKAKYGMDYAIFEDDIFVLNLTWLEEFRTIYKKRVGLPFICYVRPNLLTLDLAKTLKDCGCHIIRMAIETGNENLRRDLLKRGLSNQVIINAADIVHQAGLKLSVSNMIALPSESQETLEETLALNVRCRPDHPTSQFFMPYPGMELTQIAIDRGYLDKDTWEKIPKNTWKYTPLSFDKEFKLHLSKFQKLFTLFVRYPATIRFRKILFLIPNTALYYISLLIKIATVVNYFPKSKVSLAQKIAVFFRFFRYYS
ncbi:MAG: B12-binding domain-containing radical SAM protein [Oligoflexia bacterium]|nr:B12-binding domain-containing radical SAM protein [Oligoflexia bacterium]MBF0364906.1 B12-binding domain-containing radical SAM protein [Oligoflexia bacterium]